MGMSRRRTDEYFMRRAISLAMRGTGRTSPNPMVGCVVVKDGSVLGDGFHACCGGEHAEQAALSKIADAAGADLYVNLEPCAHFGRTPPCAPLIADRGIARVVAGMTDPDERVAGKGFEILRQSGIEVVTGVLEEECRQLNRGYIRRTSLGRPWVTIKGAVSLDGGMALVSGESKWITGYDARTAAHRMRSEHDAVLVGSGTVLAHDPELTVRHACGTSPLRVVLDSRLSTPPHSKVFREGTVFFISGEAPPMNIARAAAAGAEVISVPSKSGELSISQVLSVLASRGVCSLLVEGGPSVIGSFFREGSVDWLSLFISPRIMGKNRPFSGALSFMAMDETVKIASPAFRAVGGDFLIEGAPECSPAL